MEDEIRNDEAEVAEDSTPETPDEQTEQRTDDYEGLARRIDDALAKLDSIERKLDDINAMYSTFVDAGAIVSDATESVAAAAAEGVAEAIAAEFDLDALDYSL